MTTAPTPKPNSNRQSLIILGIAIAFLAASIGYSYYQHQNKPVKPGCSDGCSDENAPVKLHTVITEEVVIIDGLAVVLEKICKENNVDKYAEGAMRITRNWKEVRRVRGQFTKAEQAEEMMCKKVAYSKSLDRLLKAYANVAKLPQGQAMLAGLNQKLGFEIDKCLQ